MNKRVKGYGAMRLVGLAVVLAILAGMTPSRASAAQRGDTYTSPSYGFTISWDDSVWEGSEAEDAEGVQLSSDSSFAIIQAVAYDGAADDCVADSVTTLAGGDDVFDFGAAPKRMDRPATARDAEGELFTYVNADESEIAMYIECRDIGSDGVLLQSVLVTIADTYEDVVGDWESVLGDIEIDDSGSANSRDEDDDSGRKDDDRDQRDGLDGDVYLNADYGFSLTFNERDWAARELEADEELGVGVEVSTEDSFGWVTVGDELKSDFDDCAVTFAEGIAEYDAISRFKKASKKFDLPESDRKAVNALYTFNQDADGETVKMIGYFECRELDDETVATVFLATTQDAYEDELPLWEELLSGIEIDGGSANDEDTDEPRKDDADEPVEDDVDEPRDDDDDTDEPVAAAASFVGPNFGFSVALDESVWSFEDLSDNGNDFLSLESEFAMGTIVGFAGGYDASACLELMITLRVGESATTFDVAPASMERPELARGATGELFVYSFEGQQGPVEVVMWVECRELNGGNASLGLSLATVPAIYEDALPAFNDVLGGIRTSSEA